MNLDEKAEKAWEFLADEARKEIEKHPDEFTIEEFSQRSGRTYHSAKNYLNTRVRNGELSKRQVLQGRAWTNVYRVIA